MNPILRNILATIAGLFIGGLVNMGIVLGSPYLLPLPEGVDPSDINSINENIASYTMGHFTATFLAHALGTLVAAFVITKLAASKHRLLALIPGFFFLLGGISVFVQLSNSPKWFMAVDLLLAYLPMAFLGYMLARKKGQ